MEFTCFVILFWITASSLASVVYHVDEERDPIFVIGNVALDANISSEPGVTPDILDSMEFSFIGDSTHLQAYEVDSRSGMLSGRAKLDREVLCPFKIVCKQELRIAAKSGNYFGTIDVVIIIDDINDNAPTFTQNSVSLEISEGSVINSTFPLVGASDIDMGPNNSIKKYTLNPNTGKFALDKTQKLDGTFDISLRLIKSLDREQVDKYTIYVSAIDGGNPNKSGTLIVNISVGDINDKTPTFTQETYNVTIKEDIPLNTVITQVSAQDGDIGRNAEITYKFAKIQLENINIFSIDRNSGKISVVSQPEYSSTPYKIIVEAVDNGEIIRKSSQAQVIVNINDTNNNKPDININMLTDFDFASIHENANIGDVVAHVEVTDADTGINGQVTCSIVDNPYFKLQPLPKKVNEFKVVVNGSLDREDIIEHIVKLYCEDGGSPALNSTKSFKVQIQDQNDNSPQFTNKIYQAELDENKPAQSIVIKVSATDPDQGPNAQIRYYVSPGGTMNFTINPTDGIIRTKHPFDRESHSHVNFTVLAVDGGNPVSHTATATILLTIIDQNDVTPHFDTGMFTFRIPEEVGNLSTVGFVKAKDEDASENGRISFFMNLNDQGKYPLTVLPNGQIKTIGRLDREFRSRYNFSVVARDSGVPARSSTASVVIELTDINDNEPKFIFPNSVNSSVELSYLAKIDSVVATIVAEDPDEGENAEINFNIISGNDDNLFKIDTYSGEILLSRKIHIHQIKIYDLLLTASDQGISEQKTSRQPLSIHIQFVNTTAMAHRMVEEQPQNMIIAIVIATVTLVLSVAIIVTICVIRKADQKKHNYRAKNMEEMKIMETMARNSSTRSSSSRGSHDHMVPSKEFGINKKEVSFSLDEESTLSNIYPPSIRSTSPNMMTFKSRQYDSQSPAMQHSRDGSTLSDTKAQNIHRMESLRLQQRILQSKDSQQQWQNDAHNKLYLELAPQSEPKGDNHSDLSEESLTGDSGRGGSEEDVRNSGLSHPSEQSVGERESSRIRHLSVANSSGISSIGSHSCIQQNFSTFGHSSPTSDGVYTFPRKSHSKNSLSARHPSSSSVNSNKKVQRLHSDHYSPQHKLALDLSNLPHTSKGKSDKIPHSHNQNLTLSYDDTMSESCNTTVREDDEATTTSGSYTINPDELCNEIDNLFFKSDTVV